MQTDKDFYMQFFRADIVGLAFMLLVSVICFVTSDKAARQWWLVPCWATVGLMLAGFLDYSRVLDYPHSESYRTSMLLQAGHVFNVMAVYALWLTGRKWKREQQAARGAEAS